MKAVILAGGRGERLAPYTWVLPKPLMPVGDQPILEIVLKQLKRHGVTEVFLCVGYLGALLETYFGKGEKLGLKIHYSYEHEPLGTAGPIALLKDKLTEPFLVMNGDLLTTIDYGDLMRFHKSHGEAATISLFKKEVKIDLGVVEFGPDETLKNYIEKPVVDHWVSMGIYMFNPEVLPLIQPEAGKTKFDLPDLVLKLTREGRAVKTYRKPCKWLDIGRHEDYALASDIFNRERAEFLGESK